MRALSKNLNVARSSVSAVDLVAVSDLLFELKDQRGNVLVLHATSVVEALPAVVKHALDLLDLVRLVKGLMELLKS